MKHKVDSSKNNKVDRSVARLTTIKRKNTNDPISNRIGNSSLDPRAIKKKGNTMNNLIFVNLVH